MREVFVDPLPGPQGSEVLNLVDVECGIIIIIVITIIIVIVVIIIIIN